VAEYFLVREDTAALACGLELQAFRSAESLPIARACVELCGPVAYLDPIYADSPEDMCAAITPFTYHLLGDRVVDRGGIQVVTATIKDPSDEFVLEAYRDAGYSVVLDDKLTILKALARDRLSAD